MSYGPRVKRVPPERGAGAPGRAPQLGQPAWTTAATQRPVAGFLLDRELSGPATAAHSSQRLESGASRKAKPLFLRDWPTGSAFPDTHTWILQREGAKDWNCLRRDGSAGSWGQ